MTVSKTPGVADRSNQSIRFDRDAVLKTCETLFLPGDVVELRVLNTRQQTVSGYFNDWNKLASAAAAWSGKEDADSVYITLNPVIPELLARAANRTITRAKQTTSDTDIKSCRWLLVDFDPKRPAGISSSDPEHTAALNAAKACRNYLIDTLGWPEPVAASSGNGAHLLVPIELPNTPETTQLLQQVLAGLNWQFGIDGVEVDQRTFNAARICTLYGTLKAKGDALADRPHRLAVMHRRPNRIKAVSLDQLQAVAAWAPKPEPKPVRSGSFNGANSGPFDMEKWLQEHNIHTDAAMPYQGGQKWQMDCPFNPAHRKPDAALYVTAAGAAAFRCSHNSCKGNDWQALRDLKEPGWRERKAGATHRTMTPVPPPGDSDAPPVSAGFDAADTPAKKKIFRLTDGGNAERFAYENEQNLRYDHSTKEWYRWTGTHWDRDEQAEHMELAKDLCQRLYDDADQEPDEEKRKILRTHAIASDKLSRQKSMIEGAASDPLLRVTAAGWDANPWLLNVQNGTINLRTGKLQPHRRNDLLTQLCPVDYDPQAKAPLWDKCLERWQPVGRVRDFLRRAVGYTLTGEIGEECAFFLYGSGRNGKSKFIEAVEGILGGYCRRFPITLLTDSTKAGQATPEVVPLIHARAVIGSEIVNNRRLNEAFVKDITGGDTMTARPMYAPIIQFKPRFKLWMYGNHKPKIEGTDDGIWARLPMIPFTVTIPAEERDPELSRKLAAEKSGILAWAVRGCLEWQQERLAPPPEVQEATEEYRSEMDTLGSFFADSCVLTPDAWTPAGKLREAYEAWASEQGEKRTFGPVQFAERLKSLGAVEKKKRVGSSVVRGWQGIGLITVEFSSADNDFALQPPPEPEKQADVAENVAVLPTLPPVVTNVRNDITRAVSNTPSDGNTATTATHEPVQRRGDARARPPVPTSSISIDKEKREDKGKTSSGSDSDPPDNPFADDHSSDNDSDDGEIF